MIRAYNVPLICMIYECLKKTWSIVESCVWFFILPSVFLLHYVTNWERPILFVGGFSCLCQVKNHFCFATSFVNLIWFFFFHVFHYARWNIEREVGWTFFGEEIFYDYFSPFGNYWHHNRSTVSKVKPKRLWGLIKLFPFLRIMSNVWQKSITSLSDKNRWWKKKLFKNFTSLVKKEKKLVPTWRNSVCIVI